MLTALLMMLAPITNCSIDIVGSAEVYFIAHHDIADAEAGPGDHYSELRWHDKPMYQCNHDSFSTLNEGEMLRHIRRHTRETGKPKTEIRFTYRSPIYSAEDETLNLSADWFPVAYRWMVYNKTTKRYEPEKECGDIPLPCTCTTWEGLVADPEACPLEVPKKEMAYLEAYYLHEDPERGGMRYVFKSKPREYKDQDAKIDWEGYPVAVEWFVRPAGAGEFEPAGTCGEVPGPIK